MKLMKPLQIPDVYRNEHVLLHENRHRDSNPNRKKAFAAAKAEPTFRGRLLKKSIKMKGE